MSHDGADPSSFTERHLDAILSSVPGRQRRMERDIAKQDLLAAVRFGTKERHVGPRGEPRWMYTFAGVVFITDATSTHEKGKWVLPACGIDLEKVPITTDIQSEHDLALELLADISTWTSHSVVVMDQSGSMRMTDATEGVTRSDLTWLTLAIISIGRELKSGERKSTDVFSLVVMRDTAEVRLKAQPYDWILFNTLVDFLHTSAPIGPGNYEPAMLAAERLLFCNTYGSCALMLTFLSDGRPSDQLPKGKESSNEEKLLAKCCRRIGKIASQLGSRLTFGAIALGKADMGKDEEFFVLKSMLRTAKEYGCNCFFQPPSLSAKDLSNSLIWLSSSVTSTMARMTDVGQNHQRQFQRFKKETLADVGATNHVLAEKWTTIKMTSKVVTGPEGMAVHRSIVRTNLTPCNMRREGRSMWFTYRPESVFHSKSAIGIAFKKRWFGEGAERLVKEFREIDRKDRFVGPAMVAKGSKYVLDNGGKDNEKEFHRVFIITQQKALQFAQIFNRMLECLPQLKGMAVPRIEFLECSVYMLETLNDRRGYLVEKMLDIKRFEYKKWNDNAGRVILNNPMHCESDLTTCGLRESMRVMKDSLGLDPILEDGSDTKSSCDEQFVSDDIDHESDHFRADWTNGGNDDHSLSSDDGSVDLCDAIEIDAANRSSLGQRCFGIEGRWGKLLVIDEVEANAVKTDDLFETEDIPQAFSCFTYLHSNRKLLVCDLQGVLNTDQNPPVFEFTDPVIHKRTNNNRERTYGRTDKGLSGIHAFFQTHQHNKICYLLQQQYSKKSVW